MANPQQPGQPGPGMSNIDIAQLLAALKSSGSSPALDNLISKLDRKISREIDAEEAELAQQAAGRKANAENMVQVALQETARQNACTHTKPRGMGTALAGQFTHRHWQTLVCQYCGKQFSDPPQSPEQKVPAHLMPDRTFVGGPQN